MPMSGPPGRALLRLAGVLSQLTCGVCLLVGTISVVLVQQNKTGQIGAVVAWLAVAMVGLVFGGLVYRGGLVRMLIAAAIDAGFGIALVTLDADTLRKLLKILSASDVATVGDGLTLAGYGMLGAAAVCLIALPQGLAFARWFHTAAATYTAMAAYTARSTARGFPPPPIPARGSVYLIPADELPSRRRLYIVLGGLAIGVGAGIGVLVSSARPSEAPDPAPVTSKASDAHARAASGSAAGGRAPSTAGAGSGKPAIAGSAGGSAAIAGSAAPAAPEGVAIAPGNSVADLIFAEHGAIAKVDAKALGALVTPTAFGFGIDAGELAEGRDAIAAQIVRDLGDPPAGGFTISAKPPVIGEERDHAWIVEELELGGAGREPRHFAISSLAARVAGTWTIVALHWATPVSDATAERMAILKTLPAPHPIADHHDGSDELDHAVRAAFASRAAFADAISERADAFNYGSGAERAHGASIKKIFSKLKAQIRLHDGARVAAGSAWDPAQNAAPWIGWAAVNVDFTSKTRAATDVTQTFRVLAILIKDGASWKIVQTQWSNGGPVH
ncbi:MAG TPA: nuclear transport factor 2 family protein [Kofleriaceae bacterium]|jgi:hypothetical protein|nr:nuclear transport factor 2 family protein [Kofleriaceae bacterium]